MRARAGARAPAKYITYNKQDIWLTGEHFKLWMIFCSSENTVLVRLRARAVAASTQTRYGMVRG